MAGNGALPTARSGTFSIRVLVVDDHGTMRKIIRSLLHNVGIDDVTEAANGEEALEVLRQKRVKDPDVIICDLHMDKMDGTEFCNLARRDENIRKRAIPVLILTGDDDELIHDVALQLGAKAVLTKPISAPDLLREIQSAVGFAVGNCGSALQPQ